MTNSDKSSIIFNPKVFLSDIIQNMVEFGTEEYRQIKEHERFEQKQRIIMEQQNNETENKIKLNNSTLELNNSTLELEKEKRKVKQIELELEKEKTKQLELTKNKSWFW